MSGRGRGRPRGSNRYLQGFLKSKEKAEQPSNTDNEDKEAKNASEFFEMTIAKATPADVLSEYSYFLRNLPNLIEKTRGELISEVETHLNIDIAKQALAQGDDMAHMNLKAGFPILDSLSMKLGLNLRRVLCPPVTQCLLCGKNLTRNHKAAIVPFHTDEGPMLATKYAWECRRCNCTFKFRNEVEENTRVFYNLDNYGNSTMGFKFYPASFKVTAFRASEMEYCSKKFLETYLAELQHSFVSSEGKCESYNDVHRISPERDFFDKFLLYNPEVGHHFKSTVKIAESEMFGGQNEYESELEEVDSEDEEVEGEKEKEEEQDKLAERSETIERSSMHQLMKFNLRAAYFNHEVFEEMVERGHVESEIFGPYQDPTNPSQKISFKQSVDAYMRKIDNLRRNELYKHTAEDCSEACRRRGDGKVASVDGNWILGVGDY